MALVQNQEDVALHGLALRQSEALQGSGYTGVWKLPDATQVARAQRMSAVTRSYQHLGEDCPVSTLTDIAIQQVLFFANVS